MTEEEILLFKDQNKLLTDTNLKLNRLGRKVIELEDQLNSPQASTSPPSDLEARLDSIETQLAEIRVESDI